jgi:tRNA (cytidine56-2'-O)-methyltransferase
MVKDVRVLRYGHRVKRDARVTTHCCLVARALGAKEIVLAGEKDEKLKEEVQAIVRKWGGQFKINLSSAWKKSLKAFQKKGFKVVHLTMYGEPVQKRVKKLRSEDKILLLVGSQKVPGEIYKLSDYNVAVTNQPHSEIAALAVLLHELFRGKELEKKFSNAKMKIEPMKKGKSVHKKQ